ncbi:hypothetical protein HNR06_000003 [Nocardiopsis arvandica]|uniref:Uncharacterized protein n=1 Tax=Nocardiopsis sinuspersici TaxID=501010 RepID=A0A7Y9X7D2_9ACTN|nr:hypothetical protein [Nocardiopsis sinuspersici]
MRGTGGEHGGGLVAAGDRGDVRTARPGELHESQTDATGGAGDHDGLTGADVRTLQHAHGGAVGHRKSGQLFIGQRRVGHVVSLFSGHGHELGEASVRLAAEQSHRERAARVVAVQGRVHQNKLAHPIGVDARADLGDHTADVTTQHARKTDGSTPTGPCVGITGQAVGPLSRPDVGVVHRRCQNPDQRLAGVRRGRGQSLRECSTSGPPCAVSTTALICSVRPSWHRHTPPFQHGLAVGTGSRTLTERSVRAGDRWCPHHHGLMVGTRCSPEKARTSEVALTGRWKEGGADALHP